MERIILNANGDYLINGNHKYGRSAICLSGTAGSPTTATATVGYKNYAGTFVPYTDGLLVLGDQIPLEHGSGVEVFVRVALANATTVFEILCSGVN